MVIIESAVPPALMGLFSFIPPAQLSSVSQPLHASGGGGINMAVETDYISAGGGGGGTHWKSSRSAEGAGTAAASLSRAIIAAMNVEPDRQRLLSSPSSVRSPSSSITSAAENKEASRLSQDKKEQKQPRPSTLAVAAAASAVASAAAACAGKEAAVAAANAVRNRSAPALRNTSSANDEEENESTTTSGHYAGEHNASSHGAKRAGSLVSGRFLKLALMECECPSAPDLQMVWAAYDADDSGALSISELALVLRDILLDRATALRAKSEAQRHMSAFTLLRINAIDRRISRALVRLLDEAPVEVLAERLFVVIEGNADLDATATALANTALASVLANVEREKPAMSSTALPRLQGGDDSTTGDSTEEATVLPLQTNVGSSASPTTPSLLDHRHGNAQNRCASVVALIARFREAFRYVVDTYITEGFTALGRGIGAFDSFISSQRQSVALSLLAQLDEVARSSASRSRSRRGSSSRSGSSRESGSGSGNTSISSGGSGSATPPQMYTAGVVRSSPLPHVDGSGGGRRKQNAAAVTAEVLRHAATSSSSPPIQAEELELAKLGVAAAALSSVSSSSSMTAGAGKGWRSDLDESLISLIDLRMRDLRDSVWGQRLKRLRASAASQGRSGLELETARHIVRRLVVPLSQRALFPRLAEVPVGILRSRAAILCALNERIARALPFVNWGGTTTAGSAALSPFARRLAAASGLILTHVHREHLRLFLLITAPSLLDGRSRSLARHGRHHFQFQFNGQGGALSIRFGGSGGGGGGGGRSGAGSSRASQQRVAQAELERNRNGRSSSQRTMAVTLMMRQVSICVI